jgi:hypothetical protein
MKRLSITRSGERRGVRTEIVRTPLARIVFALVVLALTGCGGTSRPNTATSAPADTGTGAPGHDFSVQLWRFYRYGGREPGVADVIDYAEQVVDSNCMRQAGFSSRPVMEAPTGVDDGLSDVPSGVAPSEAAVLRIEKRQGDGLYAEFVSRSKAMATLNAQNNYFLSLSPAEQNRYQFAQFGNQRRRFKVRFPGGGVETGPAEGCIAQAAKTVYGSLTRDALRYNAGNNVQRLVGDRVFAMPAIKLANKRWARCMQKRSGQAFATPGEAVGWVRSQYSQKGANQMTRKLEIRYATTSTMCKYQSGFASRYAAATWKVMRTMPLSWYQSIANARNWNARVLVKARAILSRSARS